MLGQGGTFDSWLHTLYFGLSLPRTMARSIGSVAALAGGGATAAAAVAAGGSASASGSNGSSGADFSTPMSGSDQTGRAPRSQNE